MRLLHTSDWHVGKTIRGRSRHDEHEAVLCEITEIARDHEVDVVLVAGDLFESAAPTPESEALVYETLLGLAEHAEHVVVIAGNHDNPRRLNAVAPLLALGNVTVLTDAASPDAGGFRRLTIGTETLNLALLPFVSQRGIVRAAALMEGAAFEHANAYADRLRILIEHLTAGFDSDSVNVVVAHGFVFGGTAGGGERAAHLVDEYGLTAQAFPATASYVALGHLHRPQKIPGGTPIHYCGSPLQLDFGEQRQAKQVNVVDLEPGAPAKVTKAPLSSGRGLRTISGTLAALREERDEVEGQWLRVRVDEPRRPDLADDVRALLGDGVVDVEVIHESDAAPVVQERRLGRDPLIAFGEYLEELGIDDQRLTNMFVELLEDDEVRG